MDIPICVICFDAFEFPREPECNAFTKTLVNLVTPVKWDSKGPTKSIPLIDCILYNILCFRTAGRLEVEHFEKDNDCNAHIDFITAASVSKKKII